MMQPKQSKFYQNPRTSPWLQPWGYKGKDRLFLKEFADLKFFSLYYMPDEDILLVIILKSKKNV
jgi:hypothetical protein